MFLYLDLGDEQQLVNTLQNAHPNMSAYLKQDLPARFHYNDNRRITPIVGVMGTTACARVSCGMGG